MTRTILIATGALILGFTLGYGLNRGNLVMAKRYNLEADFGVFSLGFRVLVSPI